MENETKRIETKKEVEAYLAKLRYVIQNGAEIKFQQDRELEKGRPIEYTNRFTIADLFPSKDPKDALKQELLTLSVENYISTNKDIKFPKRSEMRVFGKEYNGSKEVYIKIRVEILGAAGQPPLFVMSFHYAIKPFAQEVFPYKN